MIKKIGTAILGAALMFGAVGATGVKAQAQNRWPVGSRS